MAKQTDYLMNPNFLKIAFEEFYKASLEGKHMDSEYVKKRTYESYETQLRLKNERK